MSSMKLWTLKRVGKLGLWKELQIRRQGRPVFCTILLKTCQCHTGQATHHNRPHFSMYIIRKSEKMIINFCPSYKSMSINEEKDHISAVFRKRIPKKYLELVF